MHFVYLLYSIGADKFYAGESEDPAKRLIQHRDGYFQKSSTSFTKDWEIILTITVRDRQQARLVEKYIKSMKSRKFLYSLSHDKSFFEQFREIVREKFSIEFLS